MKTEQAQAAALIRKELKKNGVKASVRSASGSMTSSVRVQLADLVAPWTLAAIETFCNKFQYGHFDGMTDCYEYSNSNDDLPQAKFVFVSNGGDDSDKQRAFEYLCKTFCGFENFEGTYADHSNDQANGEWVSTHVHQVLNGCKDRGMSSGSRFWVKPKVESLASI